MSKIVVSNDDLNAVIGLLNDTNVEFEIHSDLQEKISRSINFNKARGPFISAQVERLNRDAK